MEKIFKLFILSILIFLASGPKTNKLEVTLNPIKPVFKLGEDICLDFKIKNTSDELLFISNRFYQYLYLDLKLFYQDGEEIKFIGPVIELAPPTQYEFIPLRAGCYFGFEINLTEKIVVNGEERPGWHAFDIRKKGKYKIKGFYKNYDKQAFENMIKKGLIKIDHPFSLAKFWSGKIPLSEVNFTID